jgi:hypothetical protein
MKEQRLPNLNSLGNMRPARGPWTARLIGTTLSYYCIVTCTTHNPLVPGSTPGGPTTDPQVTGECNASRVADPERQQSNGSSRPFRPVLPRSRATTTTSTTSMTSVV